MRHKTLTEKHPAVIAPFIDPVTGNPRKYALIKLPDTTEFCCGDVIGVTITEIQGKVPYEPAYRILRDMDVSDKRRFPFSRWNAVRSAACALKKDYGSVFKTQKLALPGKRGEIEVTRIA